MQTFKLNTLYKIISLGLVSLSLYGCKSEIPSSSDDSENQQPNNQAIYTLTDNHSSDKAVIASPYTIDVNLESDVNTLQVGVQSINEIQATNIQLHFINSQDIDRFNVTYSNACHSLDEESTCQITLVPNNSAQSINNQAVNYYITGNVNGSLTHLKPEYFIVKSLTTKPNAYISSGGQTQLTVYNNTGVDVNLTGYQFKSDDNQLSLAQSPTISDDTNNSYILADGEQFTVTINAVDAHQTSRSNVAMTDINRINAVNSTVNVIRPSVDLSPNQLTLWPNQIRTITLENNTPAIAKISDISLANFDGVSLDTSDCDGGIAKFSSCEVRLTSKKKLVTKEADLTVSGYNFDTQTASIYTEFPNPQIKPTNIKMTPTELILRPSHDNTISIVNLSDRQAAYIKSIDLPSLTDTEVTSNTCGNIISASGSCQISFSVKHKAAKQRAYLSISGKNFLSQRSQITTIPTPRAKKATRVEITPSQLTLIPNHTQKLTVKNLTSNKAYLKAIDLPNFSGVLITDNCSNLDYITSKGSCEIIFHSGKHIASSSNAVAVYGKNFLSQEAHIMAKSPTIPNKLTTIDLIPNKITLLPNQTKSIVINNQSRVATKDLNIVIPTLEGVTVTNTTCGEELLGKSSCRIEFKASNNVLSKQSESLFVTGKNFLSKQAQIDTNNPKIQLNKLTRVEITPSQLVLLPSQTRVMTISNMTAAAAEIKELDLPDLSGVEITNNCGSEIAGLSSCSIEYKANKVIASANDKIIIYGKNFLSQKGQVITKVVRPPVIPTSVELNTNQVTLLPNETKKIVVTNRTKISTQGLAVNVPELDGVSVNNGCQGQVLAKSESCIIQLKANKKFPTQKATLKVSGDNFLSHTVEVTTKMLNPSYKPTRVEISPSKLVLLSDETKTVTLTNRTSVKAKIKTISLPSLSGVIITNNCPDELDGNTSCYITFKANNELQGQESQLVIEGENFISKSSEVFTHNNTLEKGIRISLSKHEVTTATDIDKQLTLVVTNNSGLSLNALTLNQTPNENPKNPGHSIVTVDTSNPDDLSQCVNISYLSPGASCKYILDYSPNVVESAYYLNVELSVKSGRLTSNTENLTINSYPSNPPQGGDKISTVFVDQHDNIYTGNDAGQVQISLSDNKDADTGSIAPITINTGTNTAVNDIFVDKKGYVYVAAGHSGYLKIYQPDPSDKRHYILYAALPVDDGSPETVTAVFVDQHGTVYAGSGTNGLYIYRSDPSSETHYSQTPTILTTDDGLASNSIQSLFVDTKGKVYVGTKNFGTTVFEPDLVTYHSLSIGGPSYSIFVNTDGKIYIGSSNGLHVFYNEAKDFALIKHLSIGSVKGISVDRNGNIYAGTRDSGVLVYDKHYDLIETITSDNGLVSDSYSYVNDLFVKGNIYVSCGDPQQSYGGLSIVATPNQ
ncbi:hypothetical protein L3V82_07455 [Thiotrichales bacterium 19S3-7]|nr:hypothetical protein [Thiotrichales bacterium 19S3-7]MCF6801993.1 hypothetical protein [Thiotrichales bacterium 19S3-11]